MAARNLTAKDILEKEFKPALRGFNTKEVDEFLNKIIRDYESYDREIDYLRSQNERLKEKLERQKAAEHNGHPAEMPTNYDIIKRLSRLEKTVYGSSKQKEADHADDEKSAASRPKVMEPDETQVYQR